MTIGAFLSPLFWYERVYPDERSMFKDIVELAVYFVFVFVMFLYWVRKDGRKRKIAVCILLFMSIAGYSISLFQIFKSEIGLRESKFTKSPTPKK
jgi:hypothetical protein